MKEGKKMDYEYIGPRYLRLPVYWVRILWTKLLFENEFSKLDVNQIIEHSLYPQVPSIHPLL